MTQEEKQLLIIDLCERLPYKVKVFVKHKDRNFDDIIDNLTGILCAVYPDDERIIVDELDKAIAPVNVRCGGFLLDESEAKPYLRSLSSMTEDEEKHILTEILDEEEDFYEPGFLINHFLNDSNPKNAHFNYLYLSDVQDIVDYLNSHYFDHRGLIKKGLALEAPEGMYG